MTAARLQANPFSDLIQPTRAGLYCPAGDFYVDPVRKVDRAIITHGHSDHARKGHTHVLATAPTLGFMAMRYGPNFAKSSEAVVEGEALELGSARVTLLPAGHMLGSIQVRIEKDGKVATVSGDFKRSADPTCPPFEVAPCDLFITEATFALPFYRHPPPAEEIEKLLSSQRFFPDRTHLIHAYSIGKAQRVIALLRDAGMTDPIYVHHTIAKATPIYRDAGVDLGDLRTLEEGHDPEALKGVFVLSPPNGLTESLEEPITSFASGWMRLRRDARGRGGDLPLILSDHADWDELVDTVRDLGAETVWITHGREDVLAEHLRTALGVNAEALRDINPEAGTHA